jgi:hypothetical protein
MKPAVHDVSDGWMAIITLLTQHYDTTLPFGIHIIF